MSARWLSRMGSRAAETLKDKKSPLLLWKVTNFEYEDSPHPRILLRVPGLSHESFDRDLNPKITSIMTTSAVARMAALVKPIRLTSGRSGERSTSEPGQEDEETFLDYTRISNQYFTFMSSSEFVMNPAMYDNDVPKWPVDMVFTQGYIGNSSIANKCEFFTCGDTDAGLDKILLWTNTYQIVAVDKTTRKPTGLPDWFKDKFKGRGCMDKGFVLRPFQRPANTFALPFTVRWADTDGYNHTNFSTYAHWAVNALHAALLIQSNSNEHTTNNVGTASTGLGEGTASAAAAASALHGITKEIVARGLQKMQVTYMKECLEGELVETHVWQEEGGEREMVWFSIVKDGEDICQMKMWYFPDNASS
ncbi:hypothetical protein PoB_004943600 [Plakobranchus ocellatus]|uniref:Uncharacterized protein n=1 Tax=Plakobranchus ocellatus TaxID=259542 RepID=A0AAV4BHX0_9GAST|nr:hypothetical protein PoB_004943600 [Plakobranchus ocellatus]